MKRTFAAAALAVLGLAIPASAAPITGTLNIAGSAWVNATTINFQPPGPNGGCLDTDPCAGTWGGYGVFQTQLPGTGYFSNIVASFPNPAYIGYSRDVAVLGGGAAPAPAAATFGAPTFVGGFLTGFNAPGYSNLFFDLTFVPLSGFAGCTILSNSECGLGAFTLTPTATGTSIFFDVFGYMEDSSIADSRNYYVGRYTTQVQQSIAQIVQTIDGGGAISGSYSANYNPVIPEPATLMLFGTGSMILAARQRRRAKKQQQ